jgi:2-furoyl-CoA dehydrogenase FAD binding subunit
VKAAPFAYARPATLDDALGELAVPDAKVLAGGQSLVPLLAMRLARPGTLVDINAIPGLGTLKTTGGMLEVGATVRQRQAEHDAVTTSVPLLRMALPWVGHRELRSRGTVCGSLAHADPAAELPAVASCLDASLAILGPDGFREIAARDFFRGAMTTALRSDELLTAARFPVLGNGDGFGFGEISRRHGDFALAGVAVHVRVRDGRVERATLTGFGVSDRPVSRDVRVELTAAAEARDAQGLGTALREPLVLLANELVQTEGDVHASRDYRKRLFVALAGRELARAYGAARDHQGKP